MPSSFVVHSTFRPIYAHRTLPLWVVCLWVSSFSVAADALDNARQIERSTNQTAVKAQQKIDVNADQGFKLQAEIEQLQAQIDNLTIYQTHLQKLVENQEKEKINLDAQLLDITDTRQGVVPLMYRMIDGLQSLIEQGVPVQLENRQRRLSELETLLGRADISEAEKYRRILEAYQIEMDYGSKLGTYEGTIELTDHDARQVDLLYMGRVTLLARSKDMQHAWLWSQENQQWQAVDSEQKVNVNKAYAITAKQQAPSLLTLPLSLTQARSLTPMNHSSDIQRSIEETK